MEHISSMEERYLTIVLLDIVGSTKIVESLGDYRSAKLFSDHDEFARSLCYKNNGREIDRSDGFLLSFELIHDAINFSLDYQRYVTKRFRIRSRIGIHWGKVIESKQKEKYINAGAKKVELEGLAKNICARTMSLASGGQILITENVKKELDKRISSKVNKNAMFACVGIYKFKGVSKAQIVWSVGETIESIQPPLGSDKVKKVGGPNQIKQKLKDMKNKELLVYILNKIMTVLFFIYFYYSLVFLSNKGARDLFLGLPSYIPVLDEIINYLLRIGVL